MLSVGPDPHAALGLIDRLNLYNCIFTNPKAPPGTREHVSTEKWRFAYDSLRELAKVDPYDCESPKHLQTIALILLRNPEDLYLAWTMSCFVPWARVERPVPISTSSTTPAAIAAREGIKAKNTLSKIVKDAGLELDYIVRMKDSVASEAVSSTSPLKRKDRSAARESQGLVVRRWGPHWRSMAVYALLVQLSEAEDESSRSSINFFNLYIAVRS